MPLPLDGKENENRKAEADVITDTKWLMRVRCGPRIPGSAHLW